MHKQKSVFEIRQITSYRGKHLKISKCGLHPSTFHKNSGHLVSFYVSDFKIGKTAKFKQFGTLRT